MQHPDEGTIHAWLDGALPTPEARLLEEHVAGCAACAAAVAEARGLLAASSRILSALDSVPGGVLPAAAPEASGIADIAKGRTRRSRWRATPWRAAAAIVLVGSVGWLATRAGVQKDATAPVGYTRDTMVQAVAQRDSQPAPPAAAPSAAADAGRAGTTAPPRVTVQVPQATRAAEKVIAQSDPAGMTAQTGPTSNGERAATTSRMKPSAPFSAPVAGMSVGATGRASAGAGASSRSTTNVTADEARHESERDSRRDSSLVGATAAPTRAALTGEASGQKAAVLPSAAMQSVPGMAMASAPRLMSRSDALRRLAGCYTLAQAVRPNGAGSDMATAFQLPRRFELLADRAPLPSGQEEEMLLRPAPGEPPFGVGTRGTWQIAGEDAVWIRIADGKRSVSATLRLVGDSISGLAGEGRLVTGSKTRCGEQ